MFTVQLDSDQPKLLSVGMDRTLVSLQIFLITRNLCVVSHFSEAHKTNWFDRIWRHTDDLFRILLEVCHCKDYFNCECNTCQTTWLLAGDRDIFILLPNFVKILIQVEYDLEHSGQDDLKVAAWDRIEQSTTPLCTAMYPPITKESFLVTANDQVFFFSSKIADFANFVILS